MKLSGIPFGTTDWSSVERTEHRGERGVANWRTRHFGEIRPANTLLPVAAAFGRGYFVVAK
jgi:hypothetical protein